MEIKNKEAFKAALRHLVEKNIRQFPFYFWFNIVINLVLIFGFVVLVSVVIASKGELVEGIIPLAMFLYLIAYITLGSFFKNVEILQELRRIHYGLDVKPYEWDHVFHFIADLPMETEEVERMKASLSFGKLINLLDLFGIIVFEEGRCILDRVSGRDIERLMEEEGIYIK